MPMRVSWDCYEVALLFATYERVANGSDINTEAAHLSQTLRDLAIRRSVSIDDTYRNVNGMKMQLSNVQYLFTDGEKGLSGASSMIRQMYEVYTTNPIEYQTILKEAIRMTGNAIMSVEDAFFAYAKGKIDLPPKMLAEYLQKAADYCHLKQPLLGMTDVKAVQNVQQKVAKGKLLRFLFWKDTQAIRNVTQLYYTFIKSYHEQKEETSFQPDPSVTSCAAEQESLDVVNEPTSESRSVILPEKADVADVISETKEITGEATPQEEPPNTSAADQLQVDFSQDISYSFTKPISYTYKGEKYYAKSWKRTYVEICGLLFADHREAFMDIMNGDIPGYNALSFADEQHKNGMRVALQFAPEYYLESNFNATTIVRRIRGLYKLFNLGNSLKISYTKTGDIAHPAISNETGQICNTLIGDESKHVEEKEINEPTAADERWLPILRYYFPDGYILNDQLGQFQAAEFWQKRYGDKCPIQGDAIDAVMKAVGVVRDDRVFIRNEEDKILLVSICAEIKNILSNYTSVYRSCIYDRYRKQLASISIYTEPVMTQQLLAEAKDSFYSVNKVFAKHGQDASVIHDARKVLRDHGGPMPVDDVAKVLWFIPFNTVSHYLSVDDESLNIGSSTWMLAEHFPVTHEDAAKIGNMLDEYFLTNKYVQASDLITLLMDRLPSIADNLCEMNYQAIFNIVQYYLRDRFNFTKVIISPRGTNVDFIFLFRSFASKHEKFMMADLEALTSELKLQYIYWESIYAGGAVRISETEFVNQRCIQFDVETTDSVLADFCTGDYLPLMSISSDLMIHLPNCRYRWNGYLLQSYVYGFSKIFQLCYSSFGKTGYYGAMVRRSCKTINDYRSLIVRVLTDDCTWETTADALEVLVKHGYQAQRKYKDIDNVVAQAKQNKLPDDWR